MLHKRPSLEELLVLMLVLVQQQRRPNRRRAPWSRSRATVVLRRRGRETRPTLLLKRPCHPRRKRKTCWILELLPSFPLHILIFFDHAITPCTDSSYHKYFHSTSCSIGASLFMFSSSFSAKHLEHCISILAFALSFGAFVIYFAFRCIFLCF